MSSVFLDSIVVRMSWADARCDLTELIFHGVRAALDQSRIPLAEIESVVLAAHDLVDGRGLTSMITAPSAACYMRDEIRLSDDALAAAALAADRVGSGEAKHSIVAAWGRVSEGDPVRTSAALFDPAFVAPFGLDELSASALRGQAWIKAHPDSIRDRDAAAKSRKQRAVDAQNGAVPIGPKARPSFPLTGDDMPRWADIVVAAVLTCEPRDLRIAGIGQSAEPASLGERDLLGMPALGEATRIAMRQASRELSGIAAFELDGLTLFDEAISVEAIGLAPRGGGLRGLCDERINSTGGSESGYAAPAMGLVRLATLANRMRREGLKAGLATGSSTAAGQTQTAMVLETTS